VSTAANVASSSSYEVSLLLAQAGAGAGAGAGDGDRGTFDQGPSTGQTCVWADTRKRPVEILTISVAP
jgi:hypothetical protein